MVPGIYVYIVCPENIDITQREMKQLTPYLHTMTTPFKIKSVTFFKTHAQFLSNYG